MSAKSRSPITTHILDLAKGKAAAEVGVVLEVKVGSQWKELARSKTNSDGRVEDLLTPGAKAEVGIYRLSFNLESYLGKDSFYPSAEICFQVKNSDQHYHVPLLLSPFGYSTYRGT